MTKKEYFSKFKKKFDYFMDVQPIMVKYGYYNYGVFIKYKDLEKSFDIDLDIPIPELIEKIIEPELQQFYPTFEKIVDKEVYLLPSTIKRMMRENKKLNVADLVTMKETIEYKFIFIIERVHTRDKHLIINTGFERVLYKYPAVIKHIKEFLDSCEYLNNFVFNECHKDKEYKKDFRINIKYDGEQMINFFRLNKEKIKESPLFNNDENYMVWGRYNIYFSNEDLKNICIGIL